MTASWNANNRVSSDRGGSLLFLFPEAASNGRLAAIANKRQMFSFLPDPNSSGSADDVFVTVDHIKDMP